MFRVFGPLARTRNTAVLAFGVILFWRTVPCDAAFEHLAIGARSAAMAGAQVGYARGPEAILINPAGLAGAVGVAGMAAYSRLFGLKELDASGVCVQYPLRFGGVGVAARLFGRAPYQEQAFSAGAGFIITPHLYLGAAAHFYHLRITSYGAASTWGLDVGFLGAVSPTVYWGVAIRNLNRPRIGECGDPLPQVLTTGVAVTPVMPLALTLDLYKDVRYPAEVRLGVTYQALSALVVRCGLQSNPGRFAAGLGLLVGVVRLDYAVSHHYDLGMTHSMSVTVGTE